MKDRTCELCNQRAFLFCPSDSAFLCWNCDAAVHCANFLVSRHLRHLLCSECDRFAGIHFSGDAIPRSLPSTCRNCSPEDADTDSLSSPSSSCSFSCSESCATAPKKVKVRGTTAENRMKSCSISVTDDASPVAKKRMKSCLSSVTDDASPAAKRRRNVGSVAEEVFEKWSRELGLGLTAEGNRAASEALSFCLERWKMVPFKVAAATSFWLGLRFSGDRGIATCHNLVRLEAISGVPAKLIVAAHAKLARVFTHRLQLQEGWDES